MIKTMIFALVIFLVAVVPRISADTTFFDNPDEVLIMADVTAGQPPADDSTGGVGGRATITPTPITPEASTKELRNTAEGTGTPVSEEPPTPEEGVLFDVIVSALREEIFPDAKEVSFQVNVVKFGLPEEVTKARINYKVYRGDDAVYEESGDLEVQKATSFIKTVSLPDLDAGTYQIDVKVGYGSKTAEGKATFIVREKPWDRGLLGFFKSTAGKVLLGIVIIALALGAILLRRKSNSKSLSKPKRRKGKMSKFKIFVGVTALLFLIGLSLVFLFADFPGNLMGFAVRGGVSRPEKLLDVSVSLEHPEIGAGEKQVVMTKIINMGMEEADDVLVKYSLWDKAKESKISDYTESVAVQTSMALVRQIYIPSGLSSGVYLIDVEVEYGGKQASASSTFVVKGKESGLFDEKSLMLVLLVVILLILVVVTDFLYQVTRAFKSVKPKRDILEQKH